MTSMTGRRHLTLVGLALGPVLVLAVFFVLPVVGMVGRGFFVDGRFDPGGVAEVLARPRTHRVLWFTIWSAGLATLCSLLLGLPAAYVLHRLAFPAAASSGRCCWCRSCCPRSWSASGSGCCSASPGRWASWASTAPRSRSSPG